MFQYFSVLVTLQVVFGGNIVEVLQENGNTKLLKYATACGLADTLAGGSFTIFAPTNDAFAALGTDQELMADTEILTSLLLYHVKDGIVKSADAKNELVIDTMTGQTVRFNVYPHENIITVEGATIEYYDIVASNGIVHMINKVMLPPNGDVVDLVSGNSNLSTLLSLVSKVNGLAAKLKSDPITVFAPSNAAFASLPQNVLDGLNRDPALLEEVLLYHVVPHTEYSAGLYNRESLNTLDKNSDRIRLGVSSRGVSINSYAHVIQADIHADNGVVHVVDHVLVPLRYWLSFGFGGFGFGK